MDAIKNLIEAMEISGEPDEAIRSTADTMLDLLNFKSWMEHETGRNPFVGVIYGTF